MLFAVNNISKRLNVLALISSKNKFLENIDYKKLQRLILVFAQGLLNVRAGPGCGKSLSWTLNSVSGYRHYCILRSADIKQDCILPKKDVQKYDLTSSLSSVFFNKNSRFKFMYFYNFKNLFSNNNFIHTKYTIK